MKTKKFKYGAICYIYDISENVFDRSYVHIAHDTTDFPDIDENLFMYSGFGLFELTKEGRKIYDQWCDDVSCGCDLRDGRCKGLANRIGATAYDIFEYLVNRPSCAKEVKHY